VGGNLRHRFLLERPKLTLELRFNRRARVSFVPNHGPDLMRFRWGARILPPEPEMELSNVRLKVPESAVYRAHPIRSEEPGPPSPSPCCRRVPRERVGMKSSRELLFASDHHDSRRFVPANPASPGRRSFPAAPQSRHRCCIQMETGENAFVHASFDRESRATVGRGGQIHDRRPTTNSNQSPKGTLAAVCNIARRTSIWPAFTPGTLRTVRSMSTVARAALNR